MDDKTKVQLCRKMIENFLWENGGFEPDELLVILNAVQTVLELEEENEAEYIDRNKIFSVWRSMPDPASVDSLMPAIFQIPLADVAPVRHGRWLTWEEKFPKRKPPRDSALGVFCDRCGNHADNMSDYCPNCGAKMDGVRHDDDYCSHGERSDGKTILGV